MMAARPRSRRGTSAIEFSLVMAFGFIPFFLALIDWSWYFFQATLVQNALQNAARVGVSFDHSELGGCPTTYAEDALNNALSGWNLPDVEIEATNTVEQYGVAPPQDIQQLVLTVSAPYTPIIGLAWSPSTMGGTVTLPFEVQVACT